MLNPTPKHTHVAKHKPLAVWCANLTGLYEREQHNPARTSDYLTSVGDATLSAPSSSLSS